MTVLEILGTIPHNTDTYIIKRPIVCMVGC